MSASQYGYPGADAAGAVQTECNCGGMTSPGPTPSPFPPSPMMPGPSTQSQSGGQGGFPSPAPGSGGPAQAGPQDAHSGHAACSGGSSHQSAGPTPGAGAGYAGSGPSQSSPMHHPPLHEAYHYGYYPHGVAPSQPMPSSGAYSVLGLNFGDSNFWKGALLGAAVTLLVTNETVQRAIMKGMVKGYSAAKDGVGELKEKFEDVQAELKKPQE